MEKRNIPFPEGSELAPIEKMSRITRDNILSLALQRSLVCVCESVCAEIIYKGIGNASREP